MKLNLDIVCDILTTVQTLGEGEYSLEQLHSHPNLESYQSDELLNTLDMMIFLELLIGERMSLHKFKDVTIKSLHLYGIQIANALSSPNSQLQMKAFRKSNPAATVVDLHEKAKEFWNN